MKKNVITLIVTAILLGCFTGCGAKQEIPEPTEEIIIEEANAEETEEKVAEVTPKPAEKMEEVPETISENELEAAEEAAKPEEPKLQFLVKKVEETVYANTGANIRKGPSTDYEKVGRVAVNTELKRTGITDNGWSEILYNDEVCYISSKLVQTEKVVIAPPSAEPTQQAQAPQNGNMETKTMFGKTYYQSGTTPNGVKIWDTANPYKWRDFIISAIDAAGITNEMSEYDKCVAINNYICSVVDFEDVPVGAEWFTSGASDYCLVLGGGVCTGFSDAFQSMCCALGIECNIVTGGAGNSFHSWNSVTADGVYYYVDVTWNDETNNAYLMSTTLWSDHNIGGQ